MAAPELMCVARSVCASYCWVPDASASVTPYWKALGMNARRRAFPGHTNSEIEYDGGWHTFDTDMAGLIFRPDGVVAGYADVVKDVRLATGAKPPLPGYPFAWPSDFNVMRDGWREVAAISAPDRRFLRDDLSPRPLRHDLRPPASLRRS